MTYPASGKCKCRDHEHRPADGRCVVGVDADQVARVQFNEPIVGTCPPPKPPAWWQFTPNPNVVDCLGRNGRWQ